MLIYPSGFCFNHLLHLSHLSLACARVFFDGRVFVLPPQFSIVSATMSKIKCVCDAVADVGAEDDSLVSCSEATIAEGGFVAGDTVLIKGKKGKDSLAILIADDACEAEKVRMSATCRRNLGLALGDVCFISAPSAEVQFATTVKVLPYDDSVKGERLEKDKEDV
jgi:hypothetical protein